MDIYKAIKYNKRNQKVRFDTYQDQQNLRKQSDMNIQSLE
jgi:hypothetical protein